MNSGKYVFAQVSSFLPQRIFDGIVAHYKGDHYVRHFTCWNQLLCMMYGQLSNRESLRDLVLTVNAHAQKAYHLGFGKNVSKTNLAKANENRDWRIYQDFAFHLVAEARKLCIEDDNTAQPKAFLNWVLFDNQLNYVTGGVTQVPAIAAGQSKVSL